MELNYMTMFGPEHLVQYPNTGIPYVPEYKQTWVTKDTVLYRQFILTKDGQTVEFDVLQDGTVKVEVQALLELLRAAGVMD